MMYVGAVYFYFETFDSFQFHLGLHIRHCSILSLIHRKLDTIETLFITILFETFNLRSHA